MEQKKDELLIALCGYQPYRLQASFYGSTILLRNIINSSIGWFVDLEGAPTDFSIYEIKPYLRTLSSMTEEEKKEDFELCKKLAFAVDEEHEIQAAANKIDWLNSHLFDYRGLIKRGLAIEAPDGMYKIK